jgi:hypothetical protein
MGTHREDQMPVLSSESHACAPGVPTLSRAVLAVLAAVADWSLLPAELTPLVGPGQALEAAYRQGLPVEWLHAVALQLVAAAEACPEPWPADTQRLQQAIATLRLIVASPFPAQPSQGRLPDP